MDDSQESGGITPKPRRRWWQISLRTLLILVTLLCVWLGWVVNRGERQRRAMWALQRMRGNISYDAPRVSSYLGLRSPRDYFYDVDFVSLSESSLTDAGMLYLKALTSLQRLHLNRTKVTDAGLAHIRDLTELESLELDATNVTDAGMAHIQCLTRLKWLHLTDTQVTDAGVLQLQGLTSLRFIDLRETQVTVAGAAKLREVLPKCHVFH